MHIESHKIVWKFAVTAGASVLPLPAVPRRIQTRSLKFMCFTYSGLLKPDSKYSESCYVYKKDLLAVR
jgi:hypothetical protein